MIDLVGSIDLIEKAQHGDELATNELFRIIRNIHMPRYVGKYIGRNVVVSADEIESEFLLGAFKALPKAKLDVGNPLNFICWRGQKAVQTLMGNQIRSETRYQCLECSHSGVMGWKSRVPVCKECGTTDIQTWMVENAEKESPFVDSQPFDSVVGVDAETAWQLGVYGIEIEEFAHYLDELRDTLPDGTRVREFFDILILEGINRDTSKNYLRDIAERWGCAQMRVVKVKRRLEKLVTDFIEEREAQGVR